MITEDERKDALVAFSHYFGYTLENCKIITKEELHNGKDESVYKGISNDYREAIWDDCDEEFKVKYYNEYEKRWDYDILYCPEDAESMEECFVPMKVA